MFEKILLFLDGSKQGEQSIPYVEEIARQSAGLINVTGVNVPQEGSPLEHLLKIYLDSVADNLQAKGIIAKACLLSGHSIGTTLLNYADESNASIIASVISQHTGATHGIENVTEKIITSPGKPLLLVPEKTTPRTDMPGFNRILVPLDGSELGAKAISWAKELALKTGAEIALIRVIPFEHKASGVLGQGQALQEQLLGILEKQAKDYLIDVQTELMKDKVTCNYEVVVGSPANHIIEYAKKINADLITMSSHGMTGLGRFFIGSVASRVAHSSEMPILLVKAH